MFPCYMIYFQLCGGFRLSPSFPQQLRLPWQQGEAQTLPKGGLLSWPSLLCRVSSQGFLPSSLVMPT